ncbi:uncharacterized protein LOC111397275 isoform X1 [Olea europaea var. sylvestris]|uniref:uncharacterized protein LOC111397275 isoform X1 n=1 Tax=Olea europaea var. sylvestris TaxID=158386 RepID=UPI000C1D21C9|nr:uncharacterized protein LOC111397275 isoform X1 [Olea europaea var. sylvestris]
MYLKLTSSFVSFCLCMVTVLTWWNPQICCYSVCWKWNELYRASIHQQRIQRQKDRRNRFRTDCSDYHKRRNDPMLSENNSSVVVELHESIIHQDFDTTTSNQEIHNIVNSEFEENFKGLNISFTTYMLPISIYCKRCKAHKFYRESEGFCCSDGKVKRFICDSPNELYNLFTSKELYCMEFKKIARGYNNHFVFTSFGVKYDKELFKAYKGIYTFRV